MLIHDGPEFRTAQHEQPAGYVALTGVLAPSQLGAVVEEEWFGPPRKQWNIAALAINERLMEQGLPFAVRYL
jgi:hypothetical protein